MTTADTAAQGVFQAYILPITGLLLLVTLSRRHVYKLYGKLYRAISNRIAEIYHAETCEHKQRVFAGLHEQAARLERPLKVLELGVGHGENFMYYPAGSDVVCLDQDAVCELYIHEAANDNPHVRILDFIPGGGEVLSGMSVGCVDAVVMMNALCCEQNPHSTIKHIHRILREEGCFYYSEHTQALKWTRLYFLQLLAVPLYKLFHIQCDVRRDVLIMIKEQFEQVTSECVYLDVSGYGRWSRYLIPPWLRYHSIGAATK